MHAVIRFGKLRAKETKQIRRKYEDKSFVQLLMLAVGSNNYAAELWFRRDKLRSLRGSKQDCGEVRVYPNVRNGKEGSGIGSLHRAKLSPPECVPRNLGVLQVPRATEEQMMKAIELANKYPSIIDYVVVGNECLDQDFADGAVTID